MRRPISYLKAIVICHGKSEKQMCEFIKSNMRLKIEIICDKKGAKSIQVTSIMKTLNGKKFKKFSDFINIFDDIEPCAGKKSKKLPEEFKIFIIMDVDDCTELQRKEYINGSMFKDHWLCDYIVPIYNSPELETVLSKAGIKFTKQGDERKKEYIKIFPTDKKYQTEDCVQIKEFSDSLRKCSQTNLERFVDFCLQI